jgi:hypothetical protein
MTQSHHDRFDPRTLIFPAIALLIAFAWACLFPFTGEGDSVMHYILARQAYDDPSYAMSAFARPLHKLLLVFPAHLGYPCARAFSGLITIALLWQTMRLAKEWDINRPTLVMPLLFFQPFVFAMAADTMTEIPAALAIVIAARLLFHKQWVLSCLLVSFTPLLRPEGIFFIACWGTVLLLKAWKQEIPWKKMAMLTPLFATGFAVWMIACRVFCDDWIYFLRYWSWPIQSYASYGRGKIYHYIIRWPEYTGLALLPLSLIGAPLLARNKKTWIGLVIWFGVFAAHSILFWRGKMASVGLVRIIAVASPFIAMACLEGWNHIADRLKSRFTPVRLGRIAALGMICVALSAMIQDALNPGRYYGLTLTRAADHLRELQLLDKAPNFFVGNRIVLACLDITPHDDIWIPTEKFDRQNQLQTLRDLPVGSVGVWDDQQGLVWHSVSTADLQFLGYQTLYENVIRAPQPWKFIKKGAPWTDLQKSVVVIKTVAPDDLPDIKNLPPEPTP